MGKENNIQPIELGRIRRSIFKDITNGPDLCLTCGLCASRCAAAGVDDFDPRKVVRMATLGMDTELVESRWPWICTMCARCQYVCPMDINIPSLMPSSVLLWRRWRIMAHTVRKRAGILRKIPLP